MKGKPIVEMQDPAMLCVWPPLDWTRVGTGSVETSRPAVIALPPADVWEPPVPPILPLTYSHCSVTPLFTSYIFTQMWFSVFLPRHILHGRMLSVS